MTHLRQAMLGELHRRNYAATTIRAYVRIIEEFTRCFRRPPDQLGPPHLRQYQAHLFTDRKLQPGTVQQHAEPLFDLGSRLPPRYDANYDVTNVFDVSPDGQRFLFILPQSTAPEAVTLVVNWPALVRQ